MNTYTLYVKNRPEPIIVEADDINWHFEGEMLEPLYVRFEARDVEVAIIMVNALQGFTVEQETLADSQSSPSSKMNTQVSPNDARAILPTASQESSFSGSRRENALSKQTVTAEDAAESLIDVIAAWPGERGEFIKHFSEDLSVGIRDAYEEVRYFLFFSTDIAFHTMLQDKPDIEDMLRDVFASKLRERISRLGCQPAPCGEWLGDSRIWMTDGTLPDDAGTPLANLDKRFSLYSEALTRNKSLHPGESLAYILAALCGTTDIAFITDIVTQIFTPHLLILRRFLDSYEITA